MPSPRENKPAEPFSPSYAKTKTALPGVKGRGQRLGGSMRILLILVVQLAFSMFLAASVMPLVLVAVPAVRAEPRVGFGLMVGVCAVCFVSIAAFWPWRRK
jgi:hypothetical protein